jgi:hypothetical protein
VALIDRLVVGHEGLAPVHGSDADGEQRERHAETDEHGVQSDRHHVARFDREEHVGEDGAEAARDRDVEERVDDALGALLPLRIEIRDALPVRGKARILHSVGHDDRGACRSFDRAVALGCDNGVTAAVVLRFLCHVAP